MRKGRTSWLKRLRSMPRYAGASRKRTSRGSKAMDARGDFIDRYTPRSSGLPVLSQRIVMNTIELEVADVRHDAIERIHVAIKTSLVLVFLEVLNCLMKS